MAHFFDYFRTGEIACPIGEIALKGSKADSVTEQVAYDGLLTGGLVIELELRYPFRYLIDQRQFSIMLQHGKCRRGKRFGIRPDHEQRIFIYPVGIAEFFYTISFSEYQLAIFYNGNRHARQ